MLEEKDIKEVFGKMAKNREALREEIKGIDENERWTIEGKYREKTKAYIRANTRHQALMTEYKNILKTHKGARQKRLYSHPLGFLHATEQNKKELREIVERAEEKLQKKELNDFIERALKMRDDVTIRASGIVAHEAGLPDVMEKLSANDGAIRDMLEYERYFGKFANAETKIAKKFATTAPSIPAGLPARYVTSKELEEEALEK